MVQLVTGEWWISMTYRRKHYLYLCLPVLILALAFLAVPGMAEDAIVNCAPTPSPTPVPGACTVAVDSTSSGTAIQTQTLTIPHTTSGSERLMLVGVSLNDNQLEKVSSITYDGKPLTLVGAIDNARSGGNDARVEIWQLVAPATGTHNVVISFTAPLENEAVAGVTTFTGVSQEAPLGTFASNENDPSPATVTVSSGVGELVFGVVASEYGAITTDPGQSQLWNLRAGSSNTYGAGSTKTGASSVTLKWTLGCDSHWAAAGVSIRPCSVPPPGPFSCPETARKLVTSSGELVGCVEIKNDAANLFVTFTSDPSLQMRTANWTYGLQPQDIPQDATGVPLSEKFLYWYPFKDGEQSHTFTADISNEMGIDQPYLVISAFATVEKDVENCQWISSDGTETFKAMSNPRLGSDVSTTPRSRSGTAVAAYAPNADAPLYLRGPRTHFTWQSHAIWIWESYRVRNPWKGDIVDFTKPFTLQGTPVSGTLWITADDGYDVSLNGKFVGNHGLLTGWRTSDLKYAYVPGHGIWKSVEKYDITQKLVQGQNTFTIQTANRYMGCDNPVFARTGTVGAEDETLEIDESMIVNGAIVGCTNYCAEPKGTIDSNPGALKYEAYICTDASSTLEAWVTTTGATGETVKYFTYPLEYIDLGLFPLEDSAPVPGPLTYTAYLADSGGKMVPDFLLTFSTDIGTFEEDGTLATVKTNDAGEATVTLTSEDTGVGALTVWIDANGNAEFDKGEWSATATVEWLPAAVPYRIGLTPGTAILQLPGQTIQDFVVNVVDQYGMVLEGVTVSFTTTCGSLSADRVVTESLGRAVVTVTSHTPCTGTVTATAGAASAISGVTFLAPPPPREPTPAPGWYDAGWQYRKAMTIDDAQVAGPLSDFPVLVSLSSDPALSAGARSDGSDILFTSADGTTKLSHEIESYEGGSGALVAWVKVPSVSASSDTILYMYYGNPTSADQQDTAGVWDADYVGVWHLKETGTGAADEYRDSSPGGQHGQGGEGNSLYVPTPVAGKIGTGQDFNNLDGSYDLIDVGDDPALDVPGNQITLEAWVRPSASGEYPYGILNHKGWWDGYSIWMQGDHWQCPTSEANCVQFNLPGESHSLRTNALLSGGEWHHVAGTYDGSSMAVFIDGLQDSQVVAKSDGLQPASYQRDVWIGHGDQPADVAWSAPWEGQIDEVRISTIGRSPDWIRTEYNNMNSPSTFTYLWGEQKAPSMVTTLSLSPESATLELHSPTSQVITARVLDQQGVPMPAVPVTFTTVFGSGGTETTTVNTDENGEASVTVTSSVPDTATVTATAGALSMTSALTWVEAPEPTIEATPEPTPEPTPTQG